MARGTISIVGNDFRLVMGDADRRRFFESEAPTLIAWAERYERAVRSTSEKQHEALEELG